MSILKEFQEFAMKGNVIDLAVGVIMGAAFGPIVSTLVDNVIMPPIGVLLGGVDFSSYMVVLKENADPAKVVAIKYGLFLNAVIKFVITAFAIFSLIKAMNEAKRRFEKPAAAASPAAPPPPPPTEVYLKEIRDLLATQKK
jgi:large conductance mechanosensitive channel